MITLQVFVSNLTLTEGLCMKQIGATGVKVKMKMGTRDQVIHMNQIHLLLLTG